MAFEPPFGLAHADLFGRLLELREHPNPEQRTIRAFVEFASTPCLWPLDDVYLEVLLTAAGFDLADAKDLASAAWVVSLLVAGDPSYEGLFCGHDESRSVLCALREDTDADAQYLTVMDLQDAGIFNEIYDLRIRRCLSYEIAAMASSIEDSP